MRVDGVKIYIQLLESQEGGYLLGIFLQKGDVQIGTLRLFAITLGAWRNTYLSTCMDGQEYMSEAVRLVQRYVFEHLDLHRIQAPVLPHDTGSIQVLEQNGFRYEGLYLRYMQVNGVWEDHNIYAMTAEEYRP